MKTLKEIATQLGYLKEDIIGKDVNPDLSQDENSFKTFKKPIPLDYRIANNDETIKTKEGPVKARKGDSIMTGTKGENWPIPSDKFKQTYDILGKGKAAKKKIEIYAKELLKPTKVKVSWSDNLLNGNPGDYLVQYGEGDYGVVEKGIFKDTYSTVKESLQENTTELEDLKGNYPSGMEGIAKYKGKKLDWFSDAYPPKISLANKNMGRLDVKYTHNKFAFRLDDIVSYGGQSYIRDIRGCEKIPVEQNVIDALKKQF